MDDFQTLPCFPQTGQSPIAKSKPHANHGPCLKIDPPPIPPPKKRSPLSRCKNRRTLSSRTPKNAKMPALLNGQNLNHQLYTPEKATLGTRTGPQPETLYQGSLRERGRHNSYERTRHNHFIVRIDPLRSLSQNPEPQTLKS